MMDELQKMLCNKGDVKYLRRDRQLKGDVKNIATENFLKYNLILQF